MNTHPNIWALVVFALVAGVSYGQAKTDAEQTGAQGTKNVQIGASDVAVEAGNDGYHLYVRQIPPIASVMLTESFELPDHKLATYSYRATAYNAVNGDEKRILNGQFLKQPHYSLISSTVVEHGQLGKAFHILIPKTVEYGNKTGVNSRYGTIDVQSQVANPEGNFWFSIRAFEKPYGDYSGAYYQFPMTLKTLLVQAPPAQDKEYTDGLLTGFSRLGSSYRTQGAREAIDLVKTAIDKNSDSLEIVLAIDTTKSMVENLKTVKNELLHPIRDEVKKFKSFRIGLVFYRDYMEEYVTKTVAFQSDLDVVQKELNAAKAEGGGDIPEAVVEALYAGLTRFDWRAESRVVIVMGDAPQHPTPRGGVTEAMVRQLAVDKNVEIQMVMLPQTAF